MVKEPTLDGENPMVRVLLVEDNQMFRQAFKEHLGGRFPTMLIDEARNGDEATEKLTVDPPDLIFMDISLPGENGFHLTQRIKKEFPNVSIALLTGYDLPEYRQAAIQNGADGFFVKESLQWDEVEALIRSIEQISSGS
jgi:two-component system response regulator YesN